MKRAAFLLLVPMLLLVNAQAARMVEEVMDTDLG